MIWFKQILFHSMFKHVTTEHESRPINTEFAEVVKGVKFAFHCYTWIIYMLKFKPKTYWFVMLCFPTWTFCSSPHLSLQLITVMSQFTCALALLNLTTAWWNKVIFCLIKCIPNLINIGMHVFWSKSMCYHSNAVTSKKDWQGFIYCCNDSNYTYT